MVSLNIFQMTNNNMVTPLPTAQIVLIVLLQLCEAMNVNVLFPFLAFMVEYFGYTGHRLGYYAGMLAGTFCAAQLVSSIFWGIMSDKYGRKPILIVGVFGTGIGMIVFGFAETFTQAIIGRALAGFLNGNTGVIKSLLTQITDSTNRSAGFSYLQVAWASGTIIGPLVGGFLCFPSKKYPILFHSNSIFAERPFFLPCLVIGIINFIVAILSIIYMKEPPKLKAKLSDKDLNNTSRQNKNSIQYSYLDENDDDELENDMSISDKIISSNTKLNSINYNIGESSHSVIYSETEGSHDDSDYDDSIHSKLNWNNLSDSVTSTLSKIIPSSSKRIVKYKKINKNSLFYTDNEIELSQISENSINYKIQHIPILSMKATKYKNSEGEEKSVLTDRIVMLVVSCYGILCFGDIITVECIPLLCKLSVDEGGLGLSSSSIGFAISSGGILLLIFTSMFLSKIMSYSKLKVFRIFNLLSIPVVISFPVLGKIAKYVFENNSENSAHAIVICLLILLVTCRTIVFTLSFTASIMLVNHSVEDEHLGKVNGIGQTFAAIARSAGPALGGIFWSIGLKYDFTFANFIIAILFLLLCQWINIQMPDTIDLKKGSSAINMSANREILKESVS